MALAFQLVFLPIRVSHVSLGAVFTGVPYAAWLALIMNPRAEPEAVLIFMSSWNQTVALTLPEGLQTPSCCLPPP
jgi:hypothetical protein